IWEPKEGLDVLHFAGFRPIPNCLDFFWGHLQTQRGKTITKVLDGVRVPFTPLGFRIKSVFAQTMQNFADMLLVGSHVTRVDKNVIEVYHDTDI
ncbi:hypothetical protein PAXINDRAFT_82277, partial [Paxillus involutus ATCC 200175]